MTRYDLDSYYAMLRSKHVVYEPRGFDVADDDVHPMLFKFQRATVRRICQLGRGAVFAGIGLGKTYIQIEAARLTQAHTGGKVLIVAPLAVTHQTSKMAENVGVEIPYVRTQSEITTPIAITNIDRVMMDDHFDLSAFKCVIIDESSILKAYSKTFFALADRVKNFGGIASTGVKAVQMGRRFVGCELKPEYFVR